MLRDYLGFYFFGGVGVYFFFFIIIILKQNIILSPKLKYNNTISTHYNLCLQNSNNSPTSTSPITKITNTNHHTQLIFIFLIKIKFHYINQTNLKLLTSNNPPASTSQNTKITNVNHHTQPNPL